jgi:hypothetical protein
VLYQYRYQGVGWSGVGWSVETTAYCIFLLIAVLRPQTTTTNTTTTSSSNTSADTLPKWNPKEMMESTVIFVVGLPLYILVWSSVHQSNLVSIQFMLGVYAAVCMGIRLALLAINHERLWPIDILFSYAVLACMISSVINPIELIVTLPILYAGIV